MPLVSVVMGSRSDEPVCMETVKVLEELGVDYRGEGDVGPSRSRQS